MILLIKKVKKGGKNVRKALIVGINYYGGKMDLNGCVNDAYNIKSVLERNADGTLNFDINLMTAVDEDNAITKNNLKDNIKSLFAGDSDIALFYYSGHGYIENTGGYLVTSECQRGDEGLDLNYLISMANNSSAKNKIIILDSCYSGEIGNIQYNNSLSIISEGTTILTACSKEQYAMENNGTGVFTNLLVDALPGAASNLIGDVTPGSVYAHIDQSLGAWEQRPIFKTNVKEFVSLRKNIPSISVDDLRKITELFIKPSDIFQLDPTYEPDSDCFNEENGKKFEVLQKYNRVNLVVPVEEKHMYYAAMNSKGCQLTPLGIHYWNLVNRNRI